MPSIITRRFTQETEAQEVHLPKDAKAVGFLNRGGEATVLFTTEAAPNELSAVIGLLFVTRGGVACPHVADYIGSAEFAGGQVVLHAWRLRDGK